MVFVCLDYNNAIILYVENKGKQKVYITHDELDKVEDNLNIARGSLGSVPDYARVPAINAVKRVLEMQKKSLFRPGLHYIVLADIEKNTNFSINYGDAHADIRDQWFHTAVIEALGGIELANYANFTKTIGDASLIMFSSIGDVIAWSKKLNVILDVYNTEYATKARNDTLPAHIQDTKKIEKQIKDFTLRVRRIVHLGEVQYVDEYDPLSLAVSQTFKVEKEFDKTELGCTGRVAEIVEPTLIEYGYTLKKNKNIHIPGKKEVEMSYYILPVDNK